MANKSGYTFFEIMVVIGITIIFGSAALLNLPSGLRSKTEIDNLMKNFKAHLVLVQQRSMNQENGAKWGIHINTCTPEGHFYEIFYGDSYASGTVVEKNFLPEGIIFLSPSGCSTEDIIFEKVTGRTLIGHSIVLGSESIIEGEVPDDTNSGNIVITPGSGTIRQLLSVPNFDFSVSIDPASDVVQAGGSIIIDASAATISGIPESVTFSASNLPANSSVEFTPASCTPGCASSLTVQTNQSTPGGSHLITVSGTSGNLVRTTQLNLSVNTLTVPDAPTNLSAGPGIGQISLDWEPPAFIGGSPLTGYKVYRSSFSGGESAPAIATVGSSAYLDSGLSSGTAYYYKISALNVVGESELSGESSASTYSSPGVPNNFSGVSGSGQANLSWSAPSSDGGSAITGYRVYRSYTSGGALTQMGSVGAGILNFTDTGLINGTTYYYKVSAVNAVGEGSLSGEVAVIAGATRIFVTSTTYNGNLGGFSGADAKCAARATAAGLSGTWKPWLSDDLTSATDRLNHNSAPYLNMRGEKVADNWADLTDGSLDMAIRYNENNVAVNGQAWTGSFSNGNKYFSQDCSRWTSQTGGGSDAGVAGLVTNTSSIWSLLGSNSCGTFLPLYCFEQ